MTNFKLKIEPANMKQKKDKINDDQLIQFQEKSPGLSKKQTLLSSANQTSPRRKSGFTKKSRGAGLTEV